jgi:hypothetical protein
LRSEIQIPIVGEFSAIVCWGSKKRVLQVLKKWGYEDIELPEDWYGVTYVHDECHPVIALPSFPVTPEEIGALAHEAVHAATHILEYVDQPKAEEVLALAVDAIVTNTLKTK